MSTLSRRPREASFIAAMLHCLGGGQSPVRVRRRLFEELGVLHLCNRPLLRSFNDTSVLHASRPAFITRLIKRLALARTLPPSRRSRQLTAHCIVKGTRRQVVWGTPHEQGNGYQERCPIAKLCAVSNRARVLYEALLCLT